LGLSSVPLFCRFSAIIETSRSKLVFALELCVPCIDRAVLLDGFAVGKRFFT
jgi:hypothetical protein